MSWCGNLPLNLQETLKKGAFKTWCCFYFIRNNWGKVSKKSIFVHLWKRCMWFQTIKKQNNFVNYFKQKTSLHLYIKWPFVTEVSTVGTLQETFNKIIHWLKGMMGKALNCYSPRLFNAKMLRQASELIEFGTTTYRQQLVEGNYCHHMSELVLFTGVNVKKWCRNYSLSQVRGCGDFSGQI